MSLGLSNLANDHYFNQLYQQSKTARQRNNVNFNNVIAAKMVDSTTKTQISFEEMLKSKYPGVYYNAMDTSKIHGGLWGRNDYPWDAYFSEPIDESVLGWTPSGAEPSMQDSKVQSKINSMAGKMSIVIPPELEEKMQNDSELAQQVMDRVDGFISKYYRPEANQGFLITFDENGEINHACIACEGRITVSSSEFVEERRAREAKHAEYERIAEENAIKRKLLEQERVEREYQSVSTHKAASNYEAALFYKEEGEVIVGAGNIAGTN